jgi:hypothetical protein
LIRQDASVIHSRTQPAHRHRSPWPSLEHLWVLLPIALVALRVQLTPITPNDFWWHLATGRVIAQTGQIPTADAWSWTQQGQPYFNQPWLAQLAMYAVHAGGGVPLLAVLQTVVIGGSFALLHRTCRHEGAGPRVATLATLLGAFVGFDNWQIRPQSYAVPLFVVTLGVVLRWRRTGWAPLWVLPLLMVVWVNVHGTFTLLPALCGTVWLGAVWARWRQHSGPSWRACTVFVGWIVLAMIATLFNPYGMAVWHYVGGLLGNRAVQSLVTEWASPFRDLQSPMTIVFFGIFAAFAGVLVWRRQRVVLGDLLLLAPFAVLAFQSVRNILWFGIVVAPVAARLLAVQRAAAKRADVVVLNRAVVALLAIMLAATLPWWKEQLNLPPKLGALLAPQTATDAVAQLDALPSRPQRLFHSMGVGSYLIWAVPDQQVFMDARIELYPYEQWRDYVRLTNGRDLDALAARYHFDGWLVDVKEQPELIAALDKHPGWQRLFTTPQAALFGPRTATATAQR